MHYHLATFLCNYLKKEKKMEVIKAIGLCSTIWDECFSHHFPTICTYTFMPYAKGTFSHVQALICLPHVCLMSSNQL